jgi:hypothetical protein
MSEKSMYREPTRVDVDSFQEFFKRKDVVDKMFPSMASDSVAEIAINAPYEMIQAKWFEKYPNLRRPDQLKDFLREFRVFMHCVKLGMINFDMSLQQAWNPPNVTQWHIAGIRNTLSQLIQMMNPAFDGDYARIDKMKPGQEDPLVSPAYNDLRMFGRIMKKYRSS